MQQVLVLYQDCPQFTEGAIKTPVPFPSADLCDFLHILQPKQQQTENYGYGNGYKSRH